MKYGQALTLERLENGQWISYPIVLSSLDFGSSQLEADHLGVHVPV